MKILIADDHALIRAALRHLLRELDSNVTIVEAADGRNVAPLVASHPDLELALLDLKLPGVNGFDLLAELRNTYPDLPIVVLSAADDATTMRAVLDRGAMGFIPKSASNEVMLGALRLILLGGRYLPPELLGTTSNVLSSAATGVTPKSLADLKLTERQRDVLKLMVQGQSNKQICRALGLAETTVKIHVTAILRALNVASRTQAIVAIASHFGPRITVSDELLNPVLP